MKTWLPLALTFTALLLAYAATDWLLRQDGWKRLLSRCGVKQSSTLIKFSVILCAGLGIVWRYPTNSPVVLRIFEAGIACLLAWNAATRDYDPVVPEETPWARLSVVPAALLSGFSPAFLLLTAILLSAGLRFWLHHATFPMRLLQALIGVQLLFLLQGIWPALPLSHAYVFTFLVVIQVSHYWITALAKGFLGPGPLSWVTDNRIHFLAASAYSWGWARFVPWATWLKLVRAVSRVERPLQFFAFALEFAAPLALLDAHAAILFSLAFAVFHLGVFLLSGLLFWDWILTDLALAALIGLAPPATSPLSFGVAPLALGLLVLLLFPMRHKLWKPMPLGWYDSPLTARMHWQAVGESGTVYRIPNSFMCPHERLYGRVNGCFFAPRPVVTYHLGEVWKPELRDAILEAGPHPEALDAVRKRFGISPACPERRAAHLEYLQAFFSALNQGARKQVLPPWLAWLKAPGDQLFYWGEGESYRRQEAVREVRLRFVEEYFDGSAHIRIADEEVARVSIPAERPLDAASEPSPKELDTYLLGLAEGRLLELPGRKKRYTEVLSEL